MGGGLASSGEAPTTTSTTDSTSVIPASLGRSASRWDRTVVLEDDVTLAPNFVPVLDELWRCLDRLEVLGVEWDIVFLGYLEPRPLKNKKRRGAKSNSQLSRWNNGA